MAGQEAALSGLPLRARAHGRPGAPPPPPRGAQPFAAGLSGTSVPIRKEPIIALEPTPQFPSAHINSEYMFQLLELKLMINYRWLMRWHSQKSKVTQAQRLLFSALTPFREEGFVFYLHKLIIFILKQKALFGEALFVLA